MQQYVTKDRLISFIALVLAIHMVGFSFVQYPRVVSHGPSWYGLDVSWQMVINYADINHLVWGRDIVHNYGPLGYLGTRIGWGISRWTFLGFDVFLVINMFCVFRDFIRASVYQWLAVLIIFICTLTVDPSFRTNIPWVLLLSAFYWMYKSFAKPGWVSFVFAVANIVLCFYIKLNTGLIAIVLIFGHLLNLIIFKKISLVKGLSVAALLCLLVGAGALLLHVDLPGYIKGTSEVVKGYNQIMSIYGVDYYKYEMVIACLFYTVVIFTLVYAMALIRTKNYAQLFFAGLVLIYAFLLRKQAIVRNDEGHYFEFFSYISLVFLAGNFLQPFAAKQKIILPFMLLMGISALALTTPLRNIRYTLADKYASQAQYVDEFLNYSPHFFLHKKDKRFIPDRVLAQIQHNTVDIFPWDSEYLLENQLNYTPRPIFQSYTTFTPYLQKLNYDFYKTKAPEYVVYDYETIDDRYPFNDDLPVNYFICKNYSFADSFTSNGVWKAVLKRNKEVKDLVWDEADHTGTFSLNEQIPIDWNWVKILKIDFDYNFKGKIRSYYYRSPYVSIELTRANGGKVRYHASVEMLKGGIMVDRWVNGTGDFVKYMRNRDELDPIAFVRIIADRPELFKDKMTVSYYNVR